MSRGPDTLNRAADILAEQIRETDARRPFTVGDYYERSRVEADMIRELISQEERSPTPDPTKLRVLRRRLEMALYVGD